MTESRKQEMYMQTNSQHLQAVLEIERIIAFMQNTWMYLPPPKRFELLRTLIQLSESQKHFCEYLRRAVLSARPDEQVNWLTVDDANEMLKTVRETVIESGGLVSKTGALVMIDSTFWLQDDGA